MTLKKELNSNIDSHVPADLDETVGILQLSTGEVDGQPFWAYLSMYPSRYDEYCAKVQAKEVVDLTQYGQVLEKGWGTEPPAEVVTRMIEEYGIDMDFEEDMKKIVSEQQNRQSNGGQN